MKRAVHLVGLAAAMGTFGFVWDWTSAPLGDSLTWHMCSGDFTSGEETDIQQGANAWDAGSGLTLRGAIWNFSRGSDTASASCSHLNLSNEVYARSDSWFSARGLSSDVFATCLCSTAWHDIAFRDSVTWSTNVPSLTTNTSIGQFATHEFGHSLGLNHEDDLIATMNSVYPFGGELGGTGFRPHEDDYVGLVTNRPDSSTGRNLMLSKFEETTSGNSQEIWTSGLTVCDALVSPSSGPDPVLAVIEGTAAQSPQVRWWLSADSNCASGTAYEIGTRTPTIGSNEPFAVTPTNYDFRGIPAGSYFICAMIDPDDDISESTTAGDNDVQSDTAMLTVVDC